MIGSLAPGDPPLPGVPTGPFGLSQTINPAQLLIDASYPLRQCVTTVYDPVLGWSQAGMSRSIFTLHNFYSLTVTQDRPGT